MNFILKALQRFIDWLRNNSVFKHASGFLRKKSFGHGKSFIFGRLYSENPAGKETIYRDSGNEIPMPQRSSNQRQAISFGKHIIAGNYTVKISIGSTFHTKTL